MTDPQSTFTDAQFWSDCWSEPPTPEMAAMERAKGKLRVRSPTTCLCYPGRCLAEEKHEAYQTSKYVCRRHMEKPKLERLRDVLVQAVDCLNNETPEDCTREEARKDTIQLIRDVLRVLDGC